jgi:3-dehydroquinate synthase
MKTIEINTGQSVSRIYVGESFTNVQKYLTAKKTVIITDENIIRIYGNDIPPCPVIVIGTGEKIKTLETMRYIFERLIAVEADRSTFILGIGGGIVCDIAGFAASVYMRGLRFGFVSTTLLSQVDASVGGKNGVNFNNFKNMIGVFRQPEFVICDTQMLETLETAHVREGFAEVVKAALIKDGSFFSYLEENQDKALGLDSTVIDKIIQRSVEIKAAVVQNDEREKGERKILNFGHSFAHTIENLTGISHGEAVSIGIGLASKLSEKMGYISHADVIRISMLLESFGLPVSLEINMSDVIDSMKKDKKREGNMIHFILLDRIGNAIINPLSYKYLEELINDLR